MIKSWRLTRVKDTGKHAEDASVRFLKKQSARILYRNFAWRWGEIDVIAQHKSLLLFIEVRYRKNQSYGGSVESITLSKQKKIIRTAELFLQKYPQWQAYPCRFDVITAQDNAAGQFTLKWIQQAFDCPV